jgi:hypothetical protein
VDNEDCQVILTDWYYDEDGNWKGDFVSVNLTDRQLSVHVSLEKVNGYKVGRWWSDDIRPGCALHYIPPMDEEWKYSQQEKILQIDGYAYLSDAAAHDHFGTVDFTILPEGGGTREFPVRQLTEKDLILVDNAYAKVAVIDSAPVSSLGCTYTVYCYNPSDKTYYVSLENLTENGTDEGGWNLGSLKPGEQLLRTFNYFHEGNASELKVTCDVLAYEENYENALFREPVKFTLDW